MSESKDYTEEITAIEQAISALTATTKLKFDIVTIHRLDANLLQNIGDCIKALELFKNTVQNQEPEFVRHERDLKHD